MNIFITKHAKDRIKERVILGGMPMPMIAEKALQSKEKIPESFEKSQCYMPARGFTTYLYRYYRKVVWIFQEREEGAALLTAYAWDNRLNKKQNA